MDMHIAPPVQSKRGRPSKVDAADRHDRFLDHALGQFLAFGYRATTMDGLAASFGASKSTIYRHYRSKAGLLRAAMERAVPMLAIPLAQVRSTPDRPMRDVLREYGGVIQVYHGQPSIRAMWRAVSEAGEELGEMVGQVVDLQTRALAPIADYLAVMGHQGRLRVASPRVAAACYSELVSGGLNSFLGPPLREEERESALDFALELFLDGLRPRPDDQTCDE